MAERLGDLTRDPPRLLGTIGGDAGRNAADGEDAVPVHVLDRIVEFERAVLAAHGEDGDLAIEGNKPLDEGRLPAQIPQRRQGSRLVADQSLSFAVIAEAPRLQDRGQLHTEKRTTQA